MKTLFKNILVLAVMLGTYTSYANTTLEVSPTFNNVSKGDFISVFNASGEILYSGNINYTGNLKNLYDFSQLKDGIYTIEVNKAFEILINKIQVKSNKVTFIESTNEKIFKPVFRTKDSRVLISKLAIDTKEMDVEIYFGNELIHAETVTGEEVLKRTYKLDQTITGDYTAVIRSNGRVYVENFRI